MSAKTKDITLTSADRNIINHGKWLTDVHMEHFHHLLRNCSDYRPVETWRIQLPSTIQPIPIDRKHIQILHSSSGLADGHWVCSYYDRKNIFIFDSLNNKTLHEDHVQFLKRLFPTYDFQKHPIKFPKVQRQPNNNDCGVFAIAFATSLLFNIKPDKVMYEHKLMRIHLIKILETNVIEHFPQDIQYIAQKVLPLTVIKVREAEAIRVRTIRQSETEQQKSNRLTKLRNNYASKKQINEIQYEHQNATKERQILQSVSEELQLGQNATKMIMDSKIIIEELDNNMEELVNNIVTEQNIKTEGSQNKDLYQEQKCAKKRRRYHQDKEKNHAKKRCRYQQDKEKNRIKKRLRYLKNVQYERDRQKAVNRDRKWLYNKRYYDNKKLKTCHVKKSSDIAKNIIRKYEKFWSRNYIKFHNPKVIENIYNKLDLKNQIEKRLEAEKIVRCCMHIRNSYIRNTYKILTLLKKKSEVCLSLATDDKCKIIGDKIAALCGKSRHTASSENYFIDSTYHNFTLSEPLVMNVVGQNINVLPLIEGQAKKSWLCNKLCKTDDPLLIDRYETFLRAISTCTFKKVPKLLQKIHECTIKKKTNTKLGHTHICYIETTLCKAMFLSIQLLSPHFPKVRYFKRLVYQLTNFYKKMLNLEKALTSADFDTLNQIITSAQEKANHTYKHEHSEISLSDEDIISKYKNAFKALIKRSMDTPRYVCVSCERLCFKKNVFKFNIQIAHEDKSPIWRDLMAYIKKYNINAEYICDYCQRKFRDGVLPAYCVLNNLIVHDVPKIIASLNAFEKILIQRAKAFQTVVKMGTVMNKKLPHRQMVSKIRGRTFHLPLPLQETLNKLCKNTDPININHELYIAVRGIPTKSKIVWEEMVNVKKVFDALTWLKHNNFFYNHIVLPDTYNELDVVIEKLSNAQFVIQDTENDNECILDDDHDLSSSKMKLAETKNDVESILNKQHEAMLTQIIDENDSYEQYTIYPLYEKKTCETATALYQMLKIHDLPLDNREKDLDLLCFPDLYSYGVNGQHETRPIKLQEHEFIKCRLKSKHPQFRLNLQYLFHLLSNANQRQLSRGIFHKLNITNLRDRYTATEYLDAISKHLLESDLSTIFSTLRNTEQYWRKPRSDLNCMTQHYGPATFFLTLSPSEWEWDELAKYIREVNEWSDSSLSTSVLISRDPVSTSRFLDNQFKAMLDFICSKDNPIGEVTHYFWRREYQGRGIQHFHLLLWIKDAPIIGKSSAEEVCKFILQHITCKMPNKNISPILYKRVNMYQQHKHNDYCLRSKKVGRKVVRICRFGFPRPVTETLIMRDVVSSIAGRKQLKHKSRLYDLPRTDTEIGINDYNPILLTAWEGNMDIQFIGEKSSLLTYYVTKYLNKAGKCELSDSILDSKNNKKKSLASCLWNIALRFLNNRECGALEAADTLLGIPLYGTDRNTNIRWLDVNQMRYRKVKSCKEIEALDGDSTDIFCPSIIDSHYPNRPKEFESMSLYEFAQWYDITKIKPRCKNIEYQEMNNGYYLKRRQRGYLINHYKYDINTRPENYFFSLLIMFKPWRKIEELKDRCDTYAESFHKVKLHLVKALEYHEKLEELQKAFETAKQLLQQQFDDLEKQNVFQDDPENPIGHQNVQNIEAGEAMHDFKDLGNKQEIDLNEMITKLNIDQKRVFDKVTNTITSGESLLRLYVSGEGGTGKSILIKTIKCWIKQNINKDAAVVAPTGIAAFNIDGLTVHRLLQLPVEHGHTPKYKPLSDHVLKVLRADLKNVSLIIIDEVSMISNLIFMYIHLRLCEIFDTSDCNNGWFGQKHILLFGDLLQLPPVHGDLIFIKLSDENIRKYLGSLSAINLWTLFDFDELTINMRQQGDESYRELLSRIRVGLLTKSHCEILEKRKVTFKGESFVTRLNELCEIITNLPSDTVCLLPTCNMCDELNAAMLGRISSKEILLIAEDMIDCLPYIKKRITKVMTENDDDNSRTAGLSKQITIKIGAKVMIRRNIDASLGLVNGTIATVISVEQDPNSNYIEKIKLLLASGLEYLIERVSVKFQVMDSAYVIRKQFPLTLSYGITIHKSQGLSLRNAIMDIGNSVFSCGQVYVALSRVTTLEGLHIINFDPSSVFASEKAIIEYNRLKQVYNPKSEMISISKECYYKVKDVPWMLSKIITSVQESDLKVHSKSNAWIIYGFQNKDKVSCYANTVLQCLMHLPIFRKKLLNDEKLDVLNLFVHQYEHGMTNLNTYEIRQSLGKYFSDAIKRDAFEFIKALCKKYEYIKDIVEHQVTSTCRCNSCGYTKVIAANNVLVSISTDNLKKKSYNLNELLSITFTSHWCQSFEKTCERCERKDMLFKNELISTKDILIIHLIMFFMQDDKLVKIPHKFNLCSIPTSKIKITGQTYRVKNAIFHHGLSIEEGHYTTMCREGTSSTWIETNDAQVAKKQWPRGAKDIYIIFLEKMNTKHIY